MASINSKDTVCLVFQKMKPLLLGSFSCFTEEKTE